VTTLFDRVCEQLLNKFAQQGVPFAKAYAELCDRINRQYPNDGDSRREKLLADAHNFISLIYRKNGRLNAYPFIEEDEAAPRPHTNGHDTHHTNGHDNSTITAGEDAIPAEFSDEAIALKFTETHSDTLRYAAAWGKWLLWTNARWEFDETMRAFDFSRATCRAVSSGAPKKLATGIASARTVAGIISLARPIAGMRRP
jgi:hypothetical protein